MGQSIAKRALISKPASIYDTSVWARRYRHDFEALQLSEEQVRLMWDEYCKIDEDKSGEISLWELFEALDMKQSKFTKRIFRIFDEDGSGSVDFREFVMSLWNYCTLSKAALIMFAFDLYDNDNSGEIDIGEVELLLREVYGREFQSNTHAQTIMAKLRGSELGLARNINVDQFREFCRTHPAVLYPAFVLQTQMQEKILGSKFWIACSNARVALSSGAYVNIAAILHAHVNEKAFAALVDSKDAVTGKQVTPLADSDNVAMLQMSGTLANRRLLRTTIKSHMGNIQAMAKEENGANNAGGRHSQVIQGAKVDHTPPAASPPAGEGRKGVSWGTVKTHKVYVVDSGGDDNGSEVVDPAITTQVPPEAPQEVTVSPTQPAATASPARAPNPTDSATVPTRLRQESKLAPHANAGQHRISGGSQKTSTTRPKPSAGTASRNSLVTRTQVKAMSARRKPGQPARGSSDGTHR